MDSATKRPEDMNSDELKKHLEAGTVGGTKPTKSGKVTAKKVIATAKKAAKKSAKKAPAKKPAAKVKAKKPSKKPAKKQRANLSLIDLDKLKKLVGVKGGATVPKLMKALKQPRINVSRALARLGKVCKVKSVRAPHEGKCGQRPYIYTLG